jgi:thymidylate synthase
MNNLDKQYQQLLSDIIEFGVEKDDRTGTGTISEFGHQFRHKMSDGFPLLTTKKMAWNVMVAELLWFLRGDTNIKFLLDYNCHIWDGDAYKGYEKQCEIHGVDPMEKEKFISSIKLGNNKEPNFIPDLTGYRLGDLGPIYGAQWRSWKVGKGIETTLKTEDGETIYESAYMYIDQIQKLIDELKTNPDSRRLMVNAWNVGELDQMVLPPCHYGFQLYTRKTTREEKIVNPGKYRAISLMWNQRSVDTFLGLPFNIASYGLLLEIIAKEVDMVPDELIGNLGDVHLYKNHIEQAKEQISREPYPLPSVTITERNWYQHQLVKERLGPKSLSEKILSYRPECFQLNDYQSHPKIKAPLSN